MGVPPSSISSAVRRLKDLMILDSDAGGAYFVADAVFAAWLARE
jgi:hypothetical protein